MTYEYNVIPAPTKGQKDKRAKTADARYAVALSAMLNAEAANGWEFVRAEVLPTEERQGLRGSRTVFVNVLVFRREKAPSIDPVTQEAVRMIERGGARQPTEPLPDPGTSPQTRLKIVPDGQRGDRRADTQASPAPVRWPVQCPSAMR